MSKVGLRVDPGRLPVPLLHSKSQLGFYLSQ